MVIVGVIIGLWMTSPIWFIGLTFTGVSAYSIGERLGERFMLHTKKDIDGDEVVILDVKKRNRSE